MVRIIPILEETMRCALYYEEGALFAHWLSDTDKPVIETVKVINHDVPDAIREFVRTADVRTLTGFNDLLSRVSDAAFEVGREHERKYPALPFLAD